MHRVVCTFGRKREFGVWNRLAVSARSSLHVFVIVTFQSYVSCFCFFIDPLHRSSVLWQYPERLHYSFSTKCVKAFIPRVHKLHLRMQFAR
jgi:hypothetical protein